MNTLSEALSQLHTKIMVLDNCTSEIYAPMSTLFTDLKTLPESIDEVGILNTKATLVMELAAEIQTLLNTAWGSINMLIDLFDGKNETEAATISRKHGADIEELVSNMSLISTKVEDLNVKANEMIPSALSMIAKLKLVDDE